MGVRPTSPPHLRAQFVPALSYTLAVSDERARVVVAQGVEPGACWQTRIFDCVTPLVSESRPGDRLPRERGHQVVGLGGKRRQVRRERVDHDLG